MTILPAEDADFETLNEAGLVRGRPVADGGVAPTPVMEMLRELARKIGGGFSPAAWWIVDEGEIVGLCSITAGPSEEGAIDIGYGVAGSRQGRGAATRAVSEILDWARLREDLTAVTAETSISNPASQRVLERNGFIRIGTRTDPEDGELICWRASVSA